MLNTRPIFLLKEVWYIGEMTPMLAFGSAECESQLLW